MKSMLVRGTNLNGGQPSHDGGGAEPVRDHREVCEVPLDVGVEDGLGPGVTQGAPVLVQKLSQLVTHIPGNRIRHHSHSDEIFP